MGKVNEHHVLIYHVAVTEDTLMLALRQIPEKNYIY